MHQVGNISFHFSGEEEAFFRSLYADWDIRWATQLEKSIDRILEKHHDASAVLEVDALQLDLGSIPEGDFERKFLPAFEEQLETELLKSLFGHSGSSVRKLPVEQSLSELLFYFLLHGNLPTNRSSAYKNIDQLFVEVARNYSVALRKFLLTFGHYTSLQQRLVFQLDDHSLSLGISVLRPGESHFITSYVQFLQAKYKKIDAPKISHTPYHKVIWQVVYAWLLTNRSSFFNRKSFLQQTIRQLAQHYLMDYSKMLRLLLLKPEFNIKYPSELLILLQVLHQEDRQKEKNKMGNWEILWKLLDLTKKNKVEITDPGELRQELIAILVKETNYLYLRLLQEPEILKIVQMLVPRHYVFIKGYARELDQHKEKGLLQGKAGSEFRIVKWQILFPLLLQDNGVGFNRKHFVLNVLKRVAAHYNISLLEILRFIHKDNILLSKDEELRHIFEALYLEFDTDKKNLEEDPIHLSIEYIIQQLRIRKTLSVEEQKIWKTYLRHTATRNQLLELITEDEDNQLIRALYVRESVFIISYSKAIDNRQDKIALQGKASGNFKKAKRQFIHSVLQDFQHQAFHKKYFVESVIKKLAGHYNLKVAELLGFLYLDSKTNGAGQPFELIKILEILYKESLRTSANAVAIEAGITVSSEQQKMEQAYKLLVRYLGEDSRNYLLMRNLSQQHEFVGHIASVLQIQSKIKAVLLERWNIAIDNRRILLILLRFSRDHGTFSQATILMRLISWAVAQLGTQEERTAFTELLQEMSSSEAVLKATISLLQTGLFDDSTTLTDIQHMDKEEFIIEEDHQEACFINNAGLILLVPFLPRLFSMLKLTANGGFVDRDAQIRAMFLMQYAVFGSTEFPEYELRLNKLLAGFKTGIPVPRSLTLTEEEIKTTEGMLQGIVQHWNKVKTIDGLREGFLQREGKLEEKDEETELTVATKAFDILLDAVPWNFRTTKFSWMEKAIQVKWR